MYAFISGILNQITPIRIVIDANGVGYLISIPPNVYEKLPALGEKFTIHTSFIVREQSHTIYGFNTPMERDCFETLLDVTGVGPKMALSLIGHLPPPRLQEALHNQDLARICKVPGIGKKTAQRLIIELQDKLSLDSMPNPSEWAVKMDPKNQTIRDAMSTLVNLGYNQSMAEKILKRILDNGGEQLELPALITAALKQAS